MDTEGLDAEGAEHDNEKLVFNLNFYPIPAVDFQPCLAKCFLLSGGILEERGIVLNQQRTLSRNAKKSKLQRIVAIYLCRNLHFLMQNQRPQN